jgi:hypothetical protein
MDAEKRLCLEAVSDFRGFPNEEDEMRNLTSSEQATQSSTDKTSRHTNAT